MGCDPGLPPGDGPVLAVFDATSGHAVFQIDDHKMFDQLTAIDLEQTRRHIAETTARVTHQGELIAKLAAAGQDVTAAKRLLGAVMDSLRRDHDRLASEEVAQASRLNA
jgi:demethoxyubiquinone hydroxylase (CLK1/Coq7/Cat5 family)